MKLGSFEIGERKCFGVFENQWIIDLNEAYRMMLIEKEVANSYVRADSEIPPDLIFFFKKNETSVPAAKASIQQY